MSRTILRIPVLHDDFDDLTIKVGWRNGALDVRLSGVVGRYEHTLNLGSHKVGYEAEKLRKLLGRNFEARIQSDAR